MNLCFFCIDEQVLPKFHFLPNMRYKAKVLTARMMNMSYLTYNELINVFLARWLHEKYIIIIIVVSTQYPWASLRNWSGLRRNLTCWVFNPPESLSIPTGLDKTQQGLKGDA